MLIYSILNFKIIGETEKKRKSIEENELKRLFRWYRIWFKGGILRWRGINQQQIKPVGPIDEEPSLQKCQSTSIPQIEKFQFRILPGKNRWLLVNQWINRLSNEANCRAKGVYWSRCVSTTSRRKTPVIDDDTRLIRCWCLWIVKYTESYQHHTLPVTPIDNSLAFS